MAAPKRLIWSSEARSDLSEIWDYYASVAGRDVADQIVHAIGDAGHLLEEHPFAGRSRDEVRPGLRSVAARSYVVFYRVIDGIPEIIRVLDGRRDVDEIFAPES